MQGTFTEKHLLGLCVIARDEAHNLPRLLHSAAPWVGEMVVVDTGSVDDTAAVATALGARVVHSPWQNSFALARNASLDAATAPWALVLDADEELVVTDAKAFAHALQTAQHAFALDCHDLRDDGSFSVAPLLRLFRNKSPLMRFEGAVHEQLVGVARGGVGVAHAAFMHFLHTGHTSQVLAQRHKDQRNLDLARAQVRQTADDPFAWYCLGQALLTQPTRERQEQAILAFGQAMGRLTAGHEGEAYVVSLFLSHAQTLLQLQQTDEGVAILNVALAGFPDSPDLRLARARAYMTAGDYAQAEIDLRACLDDNAAAFFVRLNPAATGYEARLTLGLCLLRQQRWSEAEGHLRAAAATAPAGDERANALLGTLNSR